MVLQLGPPSDVVPVYLAILLPQELLNAIQQETIHLTAVCGLGGEGGGGGGGRTLRDMY